MQKNIEKILIRIQYFAVVEGQKIECKNVEEYLLRNFQEFNADSRDWHDLNDQKRSDNVQRSAHNLIIIHTQDKDLLILSETK